MLTLTKMPCYRTLDDVIFVASDNTDLVSQLRVDSRTPSNDLQEFMNQMARRTEIYSGHKIRTNDPDAFIADLVAAGQLREVQ